VHDRRRAFVRDVAKAQQRVPPARRGCCGADRAKATSAGERRVRTPLLARTASTVVEISNGAPSIDTENGTDARAADPSRGARRGRRTGTRPGLWARSGRLLRPLRSNRPRAPNGCGGRARAPRRSWVRITLSHRVTRSSRPGDTRGRLRTVEGSPIRRNLRTARIYRYQITTGDVAVGVRGLEPPTFAL
jgi:hypothetical protein